MGIMTRVIRIFKADIHGVMDQLEDQDLLLKQHLRDMKDALNHGEARLNTLLAERRQAQHEHDRYNRQSEALEQDLVVAIQKNRDDVARKLIGKVKPIGSLVDEFDGQIRALDEEISSSRVNLDRQRLRYEQIRHKSVRFFRRAQSRSGFSDLPDTDPGGRFAEWSQEEIELELLKRKQALRAG